MLRVLKKEHPRSSRAEETKEQVARLLREGYSQADVARLLHVSPKTVSKYSKMVGEEAREAITAIQSDPDGGEVYVQNMRDICLEIIREADNGIKNSESASHVNAFMKTKLEAARELTTLLIKTGAIKSAARKVETDLTIVGGIDVTKASTEELLAASRRLYSEMTPEMRAAIGANVIGVEEPEHSVADLDGMDD